MKLQNDKAPGVTGVPPQAPKLLVNENLKYTTNALSTSRTAWHTISSGTQDLESWYQRKESKSS